MPSRTLLLRVVTTDQTFDYHNLLELRETHPEWVLRTVAGTYNLRVDSGMDPEDAMLQLVNQMIEEGINLPLVMHRHPEATHRWFDSLPEFNEDAISKTELAIYDQE